MTFAISAFVLFMAVSCSFPVSRWIEPSNWYDDGRQVDESLADVFYLVSTDVLTAVDADGGQRYISTLNEDDRAAITPEMAKVSKSMGDSLNFFCPYYRQFTLDTLTFHIDTDINTIIVDGIDPAKFSFPMLERYCGKGNLHHWDRKFYSDAIRNNILLRSSLLRDADH